jgi:adenosine deaminase
MLAYLKRAAADKVIHAEIFFDPQTHTARGIPFTTVLDGLEDGLAEGAGAGASPGG